MGKGSCLHGTGAKSNKDQVFRMLDIFTTDFCCKTLAIRIVVAFDFRASGEKFTPEWFYLFILQSRTKKMFTQ